MSISKNGLLGLYLSIIERLSRYRTVNQIANTKNPGNTELDITELTKDLIVRGHSDNKL